MTTNREDVAARYLKAGMKIMGFKGLETIKDAGSNPMQGYVWVQLENGRVIRFKPNTTVGVFS